jgi:hypothetical protein
MGEAVNRRDFIGAAIGALVAALLLPFEEFAAWCKRWVGTPELAGRSEAFRGIDRELSFGPRLPVRLLFKRLIERSFPGIEVTV